MKRIAFFLVLLLTVIFLMTNCSSAGVHSKGTSKTLPPGQMKKLTGSKSAKGFAPGQQKKQTTASSNSTKPKSGKK